MQLPKYIPKHTLRRLPLYMRAVRREADRGTVFISSETIAKEAQVHPVQVRKDLSVIKPSGRPGRGYFVNELKEVLEKIFGVQSVNQAVLIGFGKLGRAIVGYPGFKRYGLDIAAIFDNDANMIGKKEDGNTVFDVLDMPQYIRKNKIQVGILTVPAESAQWVADLLVSCGILAIWNFAPITIEVPERVMVKDEDLAAGLATLFYHIKDE